MTYTSEVVKESNETTHLLASRCADAPSEGPCCWPKDPRRRTVQDNLYMTCRVPGLQATVPRNSPVLLNFCKRVLSVTQQVKSEGQEKDGHGDTKGVQNGKESQEKLSVINQASAQLASLDPYARQVVFSLYFLAFCTMTMMTMISPTLLLYLQHLKLCSISDIHFYIVVSVIGTSVPVLFHAAASQLADWIGSAQALATVCVVVGVGLLGMVVAQSSKLMFAIAFGVYSLSQSLRVLRILIISQVVPSHLRTEVMSYHALMTPLGALLEPLLWLCAERYRGNWQLLGRLYINCYTINILQAAVIAFAMASVAFLGLSGVSIQGPEVQVSTTDSSQVMTDRTSTDDVVHVHMQDGQHFVVRPRQYRRRIFMYFCVIMFLVNLSMGLYMVSFQPLMVNKYNATGQTLGYIYEIISITAILPPIMVAFLSKRLQDRQILVIGIVSKLVGISLFLPIFGSVRAWQIVVGYILMIKASIFFFTAAMSLFTKLLGSMSSGPLLGLLSSLSALGPALAQIFWTNEILKYFGSFTIGIFAIPVLVALGFVLWPWFWTRLDSDREFSSNVRREYEKLHRLQRESHA